MSDLGELDRPGTPGSPGAWDTRSRESLTDGTPDIPDTPDAEARADRWTWADEDRRSGERGSPGTGGRAREGADGTAPAGDSAVAHGGGAAGDSAFARGGTVAEGSAVARGGAVVEGSAVAGGSAFAGDGAVAGGSAFACDGEVAGGSAFACDGGVVEGSAVAGGSAFACDGGVVEGSAVAGGSAFACDGEVAGGSAFACDGEVAGGTAVACDGAVAGGTAVACDGAVAGSSAVARGRGVAGSSAVARGGAADGGGAVAVGKESPSAARRAAVDPVKALMHRHRDLCERAVDPLEIAAGLEAHGVTDRTAARFRHRDVFSLAEEMYARVPRDGDTPPRPTDPPAPRARTAWIVLALLPGALCATAVAGLRLTDGRPRLIAAVVGALVVTLALRAALRRGPLRAPSRTTGTWTCWLVGYALLGDGLLRAALTGGPDGLPDGTAEGPWPVTVAPVLALALACAPAAGCAHLFAVGARRKLSASRGLADFSASVRPLLLGTVARFMCALTALVALTGAVLAEPAAHPQALTLGALLLLARLLAVHGHTHAPTLVLTAAATAEAAALATLFAGRLPGCGFLAAPVEALVAACGPAVVPTTACGIGALTLLVHATRRLTRASAHASMEQSR